MIRVLAKSGVLGTGKVSELEYPAGSTAGAIAAEVIAERPEWRGLPIGIMVAGRRLEDRDLGVPLADVELVIAPDLRGIEIGALLLYTAISAALSVAISYAMSLLTPKPKPTGLPLERGDSASPTYDFAGIQTTRGQGSPIPIVLGEHDTGGHEVHLEVVADSTVTPGKELLRTVLVLSEGRIQSIGGQPGGLTGEVNGLGGFSGGSSGGLIPDNIRVNGTRLDSVNPLPGARVWLRMGEIDQTPLPSPFAGAKITEVVGERYDTAPVSHVHTIQDTGRLSSVALILSAPSLHRRDPTTGAIRPAPVTFQVRWRPVGTSAWLQFIGSRGLVDTIEFGSSQFSIGPVVETFELGFSTPGYAQGPIDVRVLRLSAAGGSDTADTVVWRQVVWGEEHAFAYPRLALLGLELETTELVSGGRANIVSRVRGHRVRVWDPTSGWSTDRYWHAPPAPFANWGHPVGRNPAWLVVLVLTADWGLGKWISITDIDAPAFAAWSVYCDQNPPTWSEPRYRADLVVDSLTPAWERCQQIAAAGHGALYIKGSQISVAYRYRDAHAGGEISVPAKVRSQLFSAANVRDLTVRWLPVGQRPTVIEYEFLNELKDYAQDVLPVEDPDADFNDPTSQASRRDKSRRETVQAFGITRPSQLFRMGWLEHRLQRLVTKEVVFTVPYHALAAEIGDVVGLQSDVLRPFANVGRGMTIAQGGTATTQVSLDQSVTLDAGKTYAVMIRDPVGDIAEADITTGAGTYPAGTLLSLSASVTCDPGAVVAVGVKDQIVEDYEIVALTLTGDDLSREIRALLWTPDAYDEPTVSDAATLLDPPSAGSQDVAQATALDLQVEVDPADIRAVASGSRPGAHVVTFARPNDRPAGRARVYVRPIGATSWLIAGETLGASIEIDQLAAWRQVECGVALEDRRGRFPLPRQTATLTPSEFPPYLPPRVYGAVVREQDRAFVIRWDGQELLGPGEYFEVRRGNWWFSSEVIARTRSPFAIDRTPTPSGATYHVARRGRGGQYGRQTNAQDPEGLLSWSPRPWRVLLSSEVSASPSGTLDGLEYGSDAAGPVSGFRPIALEGNYTSLALVLEDADTTEIELAAHFSVYAEIWPLDLATVDDWDADGFTVDSGEALWRHIDFRPPSLGRPGIFRDTVDEAFPDSTLLDALALYDPELLTGARVGQAGERAFVEIESRYYAGGAWGQWLPHVDGERVASRVQVRARLVRESRELQVYLPTLIVEVHA